MNLFMETCYSGRTNCRFQPLIWKDRANPEEGDSEKGEIRGGTLNEAAVWWSSAPQAPSMHFLAPIGFLPHSFPPLPPSPHFFPLSPDKVKSFASDSLTWKMSYQLGEIPMELDPLLLVWPLYQQEVFWLLFSVLCNNLSEKKKKKKINKCFCFSWDGTKELHKERLVWPLPSLPYCLSRRRWDSTWRSKFN